MILPQGPDEIHSRFLPLSLKVYSFNFFIRNTAEIEGTRKLKERCSALTFLALNLELYRSNGNVRELRIGILILDKRKENCPCQVKKDTVPGERHVRASKPD